MKDDAWIIVIALSIAAVLCTCIYTTYSYNRAVLAENAVMMGKCVESGKEWRYNQGYRNWYPECTDKR